MPGEQIPPTQDLELELFWVEQPDPHSYVRQQNQLVEARYSLTARELKLVLYVCAMVDSKAEEFGKCRVRIMDFAALADVDTRHLYTEIRDTARSIRSKELVLENVLQPGEDKPRRVYTSWFSNVSADPSGDGYIGITLHPDLKPYLLNIQREYTKFHLRYAVRLDSRYSVRLYTLLQRWAYLGKKRFAVDELRVLLGTRELNRQGDIVKDNLPAYGNFKQRALMPAVEEINKRTDISVLFSEEKQTGTKTVVGLNFRIRKNIQSGGTLKELEPAGEESPQMELGIEKVVLSPEDQAQIDKISVEFALSARQADALVDYVARDGIGYVLEKAEIVRSKPRENAAGAFVVALRDDWKKPAPLVGEENLQKVEKAKEKQEALRRKKAEEEADQVRQNADWRKKHSRIREYLESLGPQERQELEIAALTASPIGRGQVSVPFRQSIIDNYVLDLLDRPIESKAKLIGKN
jgi:plasmid replication initiation protein